MNRDDIIRMAREAGWTEYSLLHAVESQRLVCFAALVAAHEREACALIIEGEACAYSEPVWAVEIVNDIRARGKA